MAGIVSVVETQNQLGTQKLKPLYVSREALGQTGIAARNASIFTSDKADNTKLDFLD